MQDVSILNINNKSYKIKDDEARTQSTEALEKINNTELEGIYTSEDECLEINLKIGNEEE